MFFLGLLAVALILFYSFSHGFVYTYPSAQPKQTGLTELKFPLCGRNFWKPLPTGNDNHYIYTLPALSLARSWELGTATEALLELDEPQLSIYGSCPFPAPYILPNDSLIVTIAKKCVCVLGDEPWLTKYKLQHRRQQA